MPTYAATSMCSYGEYRDTSTGDCRLCRVGAYWPEARETQSCLTCPPGQTSLVGATACYTRCLSGEALDTNTLQCEPLSTSVASTLKDDMGFAMEDLQVNLVNATAKVDTVFGSVQPNSTVVLVLGRAVYKLLRSEMVINGGKVVLVGGGNAVRRGRQLAVSEPTVLVAPPGKRHVRIVSGSLVTDNVVFQSATALEGSGSTSSGGVELAGPGARGLFIRTTFQDCRADGLGGGLYLRQGASATVTGGSTFLRSSAQRGGAVFVEANSTLVLGPNVVIANSTALEGAGGGSGVYVQHGTLSLGANLTWGDNADDDIAASGATLHCANVSLRAAAAADCGSGRCSGSYVLPAGCSVCGPSSSSNDSCTQCPKGSWRGEGACFVGCQLCSPGTTTNSSGSTSPADCLPIDDSLSGDTPTASPTVTVATAPSAFTPTTAPTPCATELMTNATQAPSQRPTVAPTRRSTLAPTRRRGLRRWVRLNLTIGGGWRRRVRPCALLRSCGWGTCALC